MIKRLAIISLFLSLIFIPCSTGQKNQTVVKEQQVRIKTWRIPAYMIENLNFMVDDFNRRFDTKVASYKAELKARFKEFKDLPVDAILDLKNGVFIDRADYMEFLRKQQAQKEAYKKKIRPEDKK